MNLEVTTRAVEVLRRSLELGGIDPATGGIRLRKARGLGGGTSIQVELAEGPLESETVVEAEGVRLFVEPSALAGIDDPVVDVEPQHDKITLRPRE
jgi:Fe-S cluster assembly iron-binding protein IscA